MKKAFLILSSSLLALFAGDVWSEETEPKCEEPYVYDEVEGKCVFHETAAFRVFPKEIDKQEVSSRFIQSTILFLPEKKGDKEKWGEDYTPLSIDSVECYPNGRATFYMSLNQEKKIIKIESDSKPEWSRCVPKEDFDLCTAKPSGWDLSLITDKEICIGV